MNQNRQIIQEQDSYQSCQFQSILLNFLNLQQDELVEIKQEDKIISCPQYHAFFLIGESEIPKNQQSQIKIQLLKVGSIKFGLGDYKRFTEQNNWPDLQGNVHHGCYLIDEYGFVYEHGKENKIYNLKDNNQKWNFQMCENDQIVLKINQERQTMTWKNCHKPEYIELNFDQKNLKLHPLIFLSGSSIKIINQRE
ncbi:unnamed protein product [Paramecium sonneborni]|uniref:Uncharacterized protein n=1 Tax=Paramecium sonneborni TaxID=65129 RepID=A0A8S1R0N7_9CILI|nr:unnamed protein product [Paramecium sonneborni]